MIMSFPEGGEMTMVQGGERSFAIFSGQEAPAGTASALQADFAKCMKALNMEVLEAPVVTNISLTPGKATSQEAGKASGSSMAGAPESSLSWTTGYPLAVSALFVVIVAVIVAVKTMVSARSRRKGQEED